MRSTSKFLSAVGVATALMLGLAATGVSTAEAHPRARVGVWIGGPLWWGPGPYYGYDYGYPYVVERPIVIQQAVEPTVVAPSAAQQSVTWYYCREAQMYYPYVSTCPSAWQEVPATPAPAAPAPAATSSGNTPGSRTAPAPVPPAR